MRRICVFCGSSPGSRPEYGAAAEEMSRELVRKNIGLVYGGDELRFCCDAQTGSKNAGSL